VLMPEIRGMTGRGLFTILVRIARMRQEIRKGPRFIRVAEKGLVTTYRFRKFEVRVRELSRMGR
jgi:hypothetical protein